MNKTKECPHYWIPPDMGQINDEAFLVKCARCGTEQRMDRDEYYAIPAGPVPDDLPEAAWRERRNDD